MREILFRGNLTATGEWAYGNLKTSVVGVFIITPDNTPVGKYGTVNPETVGQYTGLTDKNGKKIFEGDVVKGLFLHGDSVLSVATFKDGAFGLEWNRGTVKTFSAFTSLHNVEYEKIGNTHDNPELLEVDNG